MLPLTAKESHYRSSHNGVLRPISSLVLGFLFVFALVTGGSQSWGQAFDLKTINEIPMFEHELSEEDFNKTSEKVVLDIPDDDYLDFEIRLPEGWVRVGQAIKPPEEKKYNQFSFVKPTKNNSEQKKTAKETVLSRRLLGPIAQFTKPTNFETPSRLSVRALSLDHEITARNWFLGYVLSNSYILQGMKVHSETELEALYVIVEKDNPYVVRTRVLLNGRRIVLVSHYIPEDRWREERSVQERIVNSFKFLSPQIVQIEVLKSFDFLDLTTFDYPADWALNVPEIYDVDSMDAKFIQTKGDKRLNGEIELHSISTSFDTTIAKEVEYYTNKMIERGLNIGDYLETIDYFEPHRHIKFHHFDSYQALGDGEGSFVNHEFWLGIMVEDRFFYILTMVTPSREEDFVAWARNIEAFEIIAESLRPAQY